MSEEEKSWDQAEIDRKLGIPVVNPKVGRIMAGCSVAATVFFVIAAVSAAGYLLVTFAGKLPSTLMVMNSMEKVTTLGVGFMIIVILIVIGFLFGYGKGYAKP